MESKKTNIIDVNNVIKTRLYDLTYEELLKSFTQVKCHIARRELKNNDTALLGYKSYSYYAIVEFKKGIFEIKIPLTMDEYNLIYISRNKNASTIGNSFSTSILYLGLKTERTNEKTGDKFSSIQVKLVFSDKIRKKLWLNNLQVESVLLFNAMTLLDRPDLVEEDAEEIQQSFGF